MKSMKFQSAKDLYFDRLKMPNSREQDEATEQNNNNNKNPSKYEIAAKQGLCFHCMRNDTNPRHRPRHQIFGLCPECDAQMSIGYEKTERMKNLQLEEWSDVI